MKLLLTSACIGIHLLNAIFMSTPASASATVSASTSPEATSGTINGPCSSSWKRTSVLESGQITWEYDETKSSYTCPYEVYWEIETPLLDHGFVLEFGHVVMTKKSLFSVHEYREDDDSWVVLRKKGIKWHFGFNEAPLMVYSYKFRVDLTSVRSWPIDKFSLTYTPHPLTSMPRALAFLGSEEFGSTGYRYNCTCMTVLPQAISCDGLRHCVDAEDEEGCAYLEEGCGDWYPYNNYCLKATFWRLRRGKPGQSVVTMPADAEQACQDMHNATLAVFPDDLGMELALRMVKKSGYDTATIGLRKVKPRVKELRHLYRFVWQWGKPESHIAYEQTNIQLYGVLHDCAMLNITSSYNITPIQCVLPRDIPDGYICMRPKQNYSPQYLRLNGLTLPDSQAVIHQFPTKQCGDGSVVQTFHDCHWGQQDANDDSESDKDLSPNDFSLFQCRYGPPVHYTLVCDGRSDCADSSDESDCTAPQFPPLRASDFVCRNLQTVDKGQHCDSNYDCVDESDEESCVTCGEKVMCAGVGCVDLVQAKFIDSCPIIPLSYDGPLVTTRPAGVKFRSGRSILFRVATPSFNDTVVCPEGFFLCRNDLCIPTFLLNNGEHDCPLGEDEDIPADNITCPGYYRCHRTGTCLHQQFLCDGEYQCPDKDDEMYCRLSCPPDPGCVCKGLAVKCPVMINPLHHLHLRYLDLSGAHNVSLDTVHFMEFLVFFNVSRCGLTSAVLHDMPQLKILDLSHNLLNSLTFLNLSDLPGLKYLDLSHNPLVNRLDPSFTAFLTQGRLDNLETLIMQHVGLEAIDNDALSPLSRLKQLDVVGNPVTGIEEGSLSGLVRLEVLYADNPKLCCDYFHPTSSLQCHAPVDELSSCSDLLAQDFFRVFLWAFSFLAIVGNAGVFYYRLFAEKVKSTPSFKVLVMNLCLADWLMGVYMLIIGAADAVYKGRYVQGEREWTGSVACTVAGVLSFVSSEVSAFVLCLITLDRVLAICFSFKHTVRLTRGATVGLCCGAWVLGFVMAAVPLLAHMDFYGQNGICIPLPITRQEFSGQTYAFAVFICLNFILFLFIGAGQVAIYRAVKRSGISAGRDSTERDVALTRRLLLIASTDFLCWFPIGLLGLLARGGVPIPGVVNVWAAIFVLPFNSALNPFLYTLNGVLEQWQKRRMEARTRRMLARLQTEIHKWTPSNVDDLVKICVRSKLVGQKTLLKYMGVAVNDQPSPSPVPSCKPADPNSQYDSFEASQTGETEIAPSQVTM